LSYGPGETQIRIVHGREVYNGARHCLNCIHCENCWRPVDQTNDHMMAIDFELRNNWDPEKFKVYIKEITGNLCGHFQHRDPAIQERMRRNELAKIQNSPNREWEA
jgi:hypothetical protein